MGLVDFLLKEEKEKDEEVENGRWEGLLVRASCSTGGLAATLQNFPRMNKKPTLDFCSAV